MRTVGTFEDIYTAAKGYYTDQDDGCPHNPVVRLNESEWALESGLTPCDEDCVLECSLEGFYDWFSEMFNDPTYVPSPEDEADFKAMCGED